MNSPTAFSPLQPPTPSQKEVIRLENVSVRYSAPEERIDKVKEYVIRLVQGRLRHKHFLALDNVSLGIRRGEVFGLIGSNGAGKSTLLKLVARVLRPSLGRVVLNGRVAPLLELGAGFHPELTGRENIYLNGAILGFTRQEMEAKFQGIVDFAELGNFIEAPMRTYSSGMWARLGFAVATDIQPDVLIVDEILSVGDESFQRKSFERIQRFRAQGTTILLVSHSMEVIENMCHRAAWLDHGKLMATGKTEEVVRQYRYHTAGVEAERMNEARDEAKSEAAEIAVENKQRWGSRKIEITGVRLTDLHDNEQSVFQTGQPLVMHVSYQADQQMPAPIFGMAVHREDGAHVTGPNTHTFGLTLPTVQGAGSVAYTVPSLPLLDGLYRISVAVVNKDDTEVLDYHDRLYSFRVVNYDSGVKERYGLVTFFGAWQHQSDSEPRTD